MDRIRTGKADREFLEKCFHKLLINFAWWVNKVDREGNNVFEGGFLGLDNITVIDRSERLPGGAVLEQSDATGWMGMFCLNLMRIALELAKENRVYEGLATKFFEHYVYVGAAMKTMGGRDYQLWDEEDGFFYDVLRYPTAVPQVPRALAGRPDPALRGRAAGGGLDRAVHGVPPTWTGSSRTGRTSSQRRVHPSSATAESVHVLAIVDGPDRAAARARAWTRDEFLSPTACAASRRPPRERTRSLRRPARWATSRPKRTARSRAATRTGAARSGSRPPSC